MPACFTPASSEIVLLSGHDLRRLQSPRVTVEALRETYAALADNRADQGRTAASVRRATIKQAKVYRDGRVDPVGAAPKGWTLAMTGGRVPKWTVERDDTALPKRQVLKQSGTATFPLALKDGTSIKDGFVEVMFKPISGSEDRAGGLVWRAMDANNYYVVRANALEDNVVLYKTVNGVRNSLEIVGRKGSYGVKTAVPSNQWHALRVEFAGTRFKVIFNEKALFEVEDATFTEPGMAGLWTKADSVTAFNAFALGQMK